MNEELLDSCYQRCNTNQDFNDKIDIMMKSYKNKTEFHLQSFFVLQITKNPHRDLCLFKY